MKKIEQLLELFLFCSRWMQLPVFWGLLVASVLFAVKFMLQLWKLITQFEVMDENTILLSVLGLIDISMVINLLVVVFIGGYTTFVSKIEFENHEDKPERLGKINASSLKIKLIVSLVVFRGFTC
jgi:uncharacterized protein (TIGR00645 family)